MQQIVLGVSFLEHIYIIGRDTLYIHIFMYLCVYPHIGICKSNEVTRNVFDKQKEITNRFLTVNVALRFFSSSNT